MNVDITYWEYSGEVVRVCVYYTASDGSTKWHDGVYYNKQTSEKLLNSILNLQTEYVKNNWQRVEVTTPTTNYYGTIQGGHKVMLAVKKSEKMTENC